MVNFQFPTKLLASLATLVVIPCLAPVELSAQQLSQLTLKNGMKFEGKFSPTGKISKDLTVRNAEAGGGGIRPNVIVDDGLRRIFFPERNLQSVIPTNKPTKIKIEQRTSNARARIGYLGGVGGQSPFDEHGRRTIFVTSNGGRQRVVQEITEISPVYTKLQSPNFIWDMRVATSSIPSDQLKKVILANAARTGKKDVADTRLQIVRLLSMSERYSEAAAELKTIIQDFPDLNKQNNERLLQAYVQQYIDLILQEITRLRRGGQHQRAQFLLNGLDNTAAGTESLIQANEMLAGYEKSRKQAATVVEKLAPLVESAEGDPPRLKMISTLVEEIKTDLNFSNLPRMADFLNLVDGDGLGNDEKLAIGISGWLLGQGQVIRNLEVAANLLEVRNLVREYLRAMGHSKRAIREELLAKIKDREGGTPDYVAKLLANMKPPLDMPEPNATVGMFEVSVPDCHVDFPVNYTVQLPPEYDPYTRYPVIVSLHAAGAKPEGQITWWAGEYDQAKQQRVGQATRHSYIVIAPSWTKRRQRAYEYSGREQDIVLKSLRDASRRFSIDSDRVFISGHAMGGDAAWDIALAHPDLWAGMVLIGARGDYGESAPQYVTFYDENAKSFPSYLVFGGLDGDKWHENAIHLNRYMRPGHDSIVIQYQGRGNEHFYEEIQNIFKWLELHQRRPIPKEFKLSSMRRTDNFFWFAEFGGFPARTMTSPYAWPIDSPRATEIDVLVGDNNSLRIRSGAARTTVWLSPEFIDFDKRIQLTVDGKKVRNDYVPSLEVLLEDARQRADRQHVFWAKVTVP